MSSREQDDVLWKAVSTLPTVVVSQARSAQVRLRSATAGSSEAEGAWARRAAPNESVRW